MKAAFILAVAGAAVAQDLSGIPTCATSCLSSAITAAGCKPTDVGCQCGPTSAIIGASAAVCLAEACNPTELASAESQGAYLCSLYSEGLTASSSPASTTASTTASSKAASSTGSGSSTASATAATTSSATSTAATTVTSTSVVSNSTVTTHSPSAQSTNAAATPIYAGVGALAAFLGVVAAL